MVPPLSLPAVKATERVADEGEIELIVGAAALWATFTELRFGEVKDRSVMLFPARSVITAPLVSAGEVSETPSVSMSSGSVATVYRKTAVLESVFDTHVA
jgi:hypothetical protein